MNISREKYKKYADAHAPRSSLLKDCARAFLVGGLLCSVGEALIELFEALGRTREDAGLLSAIVLVGAAAFITALGVFDDIAKFAGAGTLVPITGFANAVASAAIDSRDEGFVLGVGAKIFTVAGPVLLYGTLAGTLRGLIYWLFGSF
jgi:stage V sporulation protein AC